MQLQSLEKILDGVGKLRAASVVAWAGSSAAFLGLHLSAGVQRSGVLGATILIAVVNIVDGYIRGQHVSALPALIAQGAESVQAQTKDPRVDAVAASVDSLAKRVEELQARPVAPSLPEIITTLTGKAPAEQVAPEAPAVVAVDPSAVAPAAPVVSPVA